MPTRRSRRQVEFRPPYHVPAPRKLKRKDAWSAGGHQFDENMRCAWCQRRYITHQALPTKCTRIPRWMDQQQHKPKDPSQAP